MKSQSQSQLKKRDSLEASGSQDSSQFGTEGSSQSSQNKLAPAEFNRKVAELVRYILFADKKKLGMKRADMVRNVMKEHSRLFLKVFEEASKQIKETFGYEVVEMITDDGKSRGYILVNPLVDNETSDYLRWKSDEDTEMTLLLIILSLIFMNEGALTESALWQILKKLGLVRGQRHLVFSEVDKLVSQKFVKHNYLERIKSNGNEGPVYHYKFGARALKEISKRTILEFVSQIYGVDSIDAWKIQYQEVLDSEKNGDVEMIEINE